jgi:hypothetical protein
MKIEIKEGVIISYIIFTIQIDQVFTLESQTDSSV